MKPTLWIGSALLIVLALAGCTPAQQPEQVHLSFEAPMQVNAAQEFHVSLGVRNTGSLDFAGKEQANASMELRDEQGQLRASAEIVSLPPVQAGDAAWPMVWRGKLNAGRYQLTWGAPDYGAVVVDLNVVEREGRIELGETEIHP